MANRALLVGVNEYSVQQYNLKGCRADIESLEEILMRRFEFSANSIAKLVDAEATAKSIKEKLSDLVKQITPGDNVIFAFSGHGTQKGFGRPGEADGKDEALVPHDISLGSLITDDELNSIILQINPVTGLPYLPDDGSVIFTAIYDMCHSGTMRGVFLDDFREERFEPVVSRCIQFVDLEELPVRDALIPPYTIFSACLDEETAADVPRSRIPDSDKPRGAFSYALHKILSEEPTASIADVESRVPDIISTISPHKQTPQYFAPFSKSLGFLQKP